MFEMKELPFEFSALEPYMSSETLNFHYGKHYKAYIDKLNELVSGTPYKAMPLEAIVRESYKHPEHRAIYNNAGQVWNHQFFFNSLSAVGGTEPSGKIMKQIETSFGDYENFKKEFKAKALAQFGSGWCWVVAKADRLEVAATSNADNPIALNLGQPLVCADVWEHAYYLDYQNRRADYLDAFLDHMIKW